MQIWSKRLRETDIGIGPGEYCSTRSVLHCSYLKWPLHVRPPPPEYDGAEEGEAVEGPDGEAEEVDQGSHVAEHEQDRERALKKEGVRV